MTKAQELFVELLKFDPDWDAPRLTTSGLPQFVRDQAIRFIGQANFWYEPDWSVERIRSYLNLFWQKFGDFEGMNDHVQHYSRNVVVWTLIEGKIERARQLADEFHFTRTDWQSVFNTFRINFEGLDLDRYPDIFEHLPGVKRLFIELNLGSIYHDLPFLCALARHLAEAEFDACDAFTILDRCQFFTEDFFLEIAIAACNIDERQGWLCGLKHMQAYFDPARE